MRKSNRSLRSLFCFLLPFLCLSLTGDINKRDGFTIASAGATYIVEENFEGTGYELSWTESAGGGTVDEDYTTTVLQGSQSLNMVESTSAVTTYHDHAANGTTYYFFKLRINTLPSGNYFLFRGRTGATSRIGGYLYTDGRIGVWNATTGLTPTVGSMSTGTNYDVWITYTPGGTCSVAFATSGSARPTSGNNYASQTAVDTQDVDRTMFEANNGADIIIDRHLVDDVQIEQAP